MAKKRKIAKAQKERAKNRRKNWEKIRDGITASLQKKQRVKDLKKAQKAVENVRKKAIEKGEKDRIKLARKKIQTKKGGGKEEIKKVTKRTTKNGENK